MAKTAKVAWGIDIGTCTLKAVKLGIAGDGVELLDFAMIEYDKILSQPDITLEERIKIVNDAVQKFAGEHDLRGCAVAVGMPGQTSFARFIKLPPVETKRIPEIVKFEAIQQIPFEIDDVEWDWQKFSTPDNPDIEVGIFAIKRDLVQRALDPLTQTEAEITTVQMAPMALYNFLRFDQKKLKDTESKDAVLALNIGAENTDLIIAGSNRVWQRSIPIGGNKFTEAVQKAFKLSFTKAEGIKRTANSSKYARQIFQAMRPVFADLAGEIQRSVGFYTSSNRDTKFREVIALGNAMKLPGLVKFLQQSLSLPVKQIDSFDSLRMTADVSAAQFAENLPSFAIAYGLALQAVGSSPIESNLLPREFVRRSLWKRKQKWFVAAAAIFAVAPLLGLFQTYNVKADLKEAQKHVSQIESAENTIRQIEQRRSGFLSDIKNAQQKARNVFEPLEYRDTLPLLLRSVKECVPNPENVNDPSQAEMMQAYIQGLKDEVMEMPRDQRQQVFITKAEIVYTDNLTRDFDSVLTNWSRRQKRAAPDEPQQGAMMPGMGMPGMGMPGMMPGMGMPGMGMPGMMPGQGGGGSSGGTRKRKQDKDAVPGFVVVLEGYTPHHDNRQFLFPPRVGVDRSKWGFFHHLQYLGLTDDEILAQKKKRWETEREAMSDSGGGRKKKKKNDAEETVSNVTFEADEVPQTEYQYQASQLAGQLPFETYIDPEDPDLWAYFDTSDSGWIISGVAEQPDGLGIEKMHEVIVVNPQGQRQVIEFPALVDPFTGEVISQVYEIDDNGQVVYEDNQPVTINNDFWFRAKFKVKLKNPPKAKGD